MKPLGRILTKNEGKFLNSLNYTRGYDVDSQPFQHRHIVINKGKALCNSPHLWGYGMVWYSFRANGKTLVREDNRVTCSGCLAHLEMLMKESL